MKELDAIKCPVYKVYSTLVSSVCMKEIIETESDFLSDAQMTHVIFEKLDLIANAVNNNRIQSSNLLTLIKRISVSPGRKYQLWNLNDKLLVFSRNAIWFVLRSSLFLEGELSVRHVMWSKDENSLLLSLLYIPQDEIEKYKIMLDKRVPEELLTPKMEFTVSAINTMMACSEVWAILNLLEDSMSSRIPQRVKAFFEEERLKDYEPQIDVDRPLHEQNLQRETMVFLAMLNVNYWCDSEEEREYFLREMAQDDNKKFNKDDASWDLGRIFDNPKEDTDTDDGDEYPTIHEEDNHIFIQMPFGDFCLYIYRKYSAPMSMFVGITDKNEEEALEFYLDNSWGPFLKVKNINLQDVYIAHAQSNPIPFQKGESLYLSKDESIIDQEGRSIVSFGTPDGWILEEWTDEDW